MPLARRDIRIYDLLDIQLSAGLTSLQVSHHGLTAGVSKLYHSKALVEQLAASSVGPRVLIIILCFIK